MSEHDNLKIDPQVTGVREGTLTPNGAALDQPERSFAVIEGPKDARAFEGAIVDAAPAERSWERYIETGAATHVNPGSGSVWCGLGIACALLSAVAPLLFGPTAFTLGLLARDKGNPRAFVPIALGLAATAYGIIYFRLATVGPMR